MRKHMIGAVQQGNDWSAKFKATAPRRRETGREGRRNTPVTSYFPTIKGERRMVRLRHYFHVDMALLLDARPNVVEWEAEADSIVVSDMDDGTFTFAPDFLVRERDGVHAIRLLRAGTRITGALEDRHALIREAYRQRDEGFRVITQEELASDPVLPAANLLFRARLEDVPDILPDRVVAICGAWCPTTLGVIHDDMGGGDESWRWLLCLAARGFIELKLDGAIRPETPVVSCRNEGYRR